MRELKQSATAILTLGPFLDSTDGNTVEAGLTIAQANVRISKNGGDFAQKGNASASVYDEAGFYKSSVSVVDTGTLGHLKVAVHMTGSLSVWADYSVVDKNYWTAKYSSDILDVNTIQVGGTVQTALDINDILTDTNELQGDDIPGRIDTLSATLATILADTAELQTDNIPGRIDTLSSSITVIDGNVDLILADTNELQGDDIPGRIDTLSASVLSIPTNPNTVVPDAAGVVPGRINTLSGTLATILADTNELQSDDIPGRLNTLSASVTAIPTTPMRGTDSANTTVPDAAGVVPGRLDTLSASVTVLDGNVDLVLADTNELQSDDIPGRIDTLSSSVSIIPTTAMRGTDIGNLNNVSTAQVNAEVLDVLNVDVFSEPGQGSPTATPSIRLMLHYLYKLFRNKKTQSSTETKVYNDAGTTVDQKRTVSDDGTTATSGEMGSGA